MKRLMLVPMTSVLSGSAAVLGSILGNAGGQLWLMGGAVLGGVIGTIAAARLASRFRVIAPRQVRAASIGGLVGFGIAAPLAASNLHTPVIPILSSALPGLGSLLGIMFITGARTGLRTEAVMNRNMQVALASFVLLAPALLLVTSGIFALQPPAALVHPVLVMGGMFLAFAFNAMSALRIRVGQNQDALVGTVSVRVRGNRMNLTGLALSCVLFATIAGYMFVENFQPR